MNHQYSSPMGVRAVVFDISGTVMDFGCCGPVAALMALFNRHGVALSSEEARRPMGTHKRDHICAVLNEPSVAARWKAANGSAPAAGILDLLCAEFAPLQVEVLKNHGEVIRGVPNVVKQLRARGIKIANTTGFESGMITNLILQAAKGGYVPDLWVCPDHVGKGRPAPWMIFHAAQRMDVYPLSTFVKVGDTPADVAEGHAAGTWVVSVVRSGNEVGLSESELAVLSSAERERRLFAAKVKLAACGPHYIINTAADLVPVVDEISGRIQRGETPEPARRTTPICLNGTMDFASAQGGGLSLQPA